MSKKNITIADVAKRYENPVAELVQVACRYGSDIVLINDNGRINAKSIMGVMALNPHSGMDVCIETSGVDETEALAGMEHFLICE